MSKTYTLSAIRGKVRTRLDDQSFDGAVIDEAINNYINDFTGAHDMVFQETSSGLVVMSQSTNFIPLPGDYQKMRALKLVSPTNYQANLIDRYVTYNEFTRSYLYPAANTPTSPSTWTEYGEQILFGAPADIAYSFVLDYMKAPVQLTVDGSVANWPDEFIECVVDGATYRIQKRDDDYDIASNEVQFLTPKELNLIKRYGVGRSTGRAHTMTSGLRTGMRG